MRTENTTICDRCGRPVADGAHCCNACVEQTRENTVFIEETGDELETTLTRQDKVSSGNGGRASAEVPIPLNLYASDVGHRLRNVLTTWSRVLVEESGAEWPPRQEPVYGPVCRQAARTWCVHGSCRGIMISRHPTEAGIAETARFLSSRLGWIAHREWGPECFDDLSRVAVDTTLQPELAGWRHPVWRGSDDWPGDDSDTYWRSTVAVRVPGKRYLIIAIPIRRKHTS